MTNLSEKVVQSQVPAHLVSDAPLFVAFLEAYYRFADQVSQANYYLRNEHIEDDIDVCNADYVNLFYNMYADKMPRVVAMDRRNFIKILNTIYEAKGTEKALKLAFQAVFNEQVKVTFPGENRLRASDGIWIREKYITLETKFGVIPDGAIIMSFSNDSGDYSFETTRTEQITPTTVRCYFQSFNNIEFDVGQRVFHYDAYGAMIYAGDLILSPSYLSINTPGENWQVGQVVVIPGSTHNTIARITKVNSVGGITGVEIIEFGYDHIQGQVITVSPYPNKPQSSSVVVESNLVSVDPPVYVHSMSINEYISEISERVVGISDSFGPNSYFLEDYVESYVGHSEFAQSIDGQTVEETEDTGGLTIEEWLASRATLTYEYDGVVTLRGYYQNEQGQLSNQTIKLQDNYFYQAFSYLIETEQDIAAYQSMLNILHPAGLKHFSDLTKTGVINVDIEAERELTTSIIP